jgi:hypothetical protein
MLRPVLAAGAAACALYASPVLAQTSGEPAIALGGQVGTTGAGLEVQVSVGRMFVLRGAVDTLGFDLDETFDDVDYSGRLDFDTVGAFVDLHPLANGFFVSGGAYLGQRKVSLKATPAAPVNIGGQSFTPEQVGSLNGEVSLKTLAPFVGLGFDNTFTRNSRWGFRALAGVAWSDEPEVDLDASGGTLSNDPAFRARLAEERASIQSDVEDYGFYPVFQLGLNYKF